MTRLNPGGRRARRPMGLRELIAGLSLGLLLAAGGAGAEESAAPLDLNRATPAELESLPGIGAAKAAAIVAERETRGGFRSLEELESVRGIGPVLLDRLRPHVSLGAAPQAGARATPESASESAAESVADSAGERRGAGSRGDGR